MDDAGSSPVAGTREFYNAYMREYLRRRYVERSQRAIDALGGVCVECGSVEDLQFDHVDPVTKSFEVRLALYKRRFDNQDLVDELAKCQLLCKSCHKIKSDIEQSVEHGGGLSGKRDCRCNLCRARKAEYMSFRPQYNQNRCRKKNCNCEKKHYPKPT
jgi:hypothetical protein